MLKIFAAKNIRILCIESAKTVNEMTLNELVKLTTLWTTGPWPLNTDNFLILVQFSWNFHQNVGFYVWSWNKTEGSLRRAEGRQQGKRGGPPLHIELAGALSNICFYGELEKIILELSPNTPP